MYDLPKSMERRKTPCFFDLLLPTSPKSAGSEMALLNMTEYVMNITLCNLVYVT